MCQFRLICLFWFILGVASLVLLPNSIPSTRLPFLLNHLHDIMSLKIVVVYLLCVPFFFYVAGAKRTAT